MTKKHKCQMQFTNLLHLKTKLQNYFKTIQKTCKVIFFFILEIMHPRSGLACSTDGKNIYIFGGKNED